ncbi:hypothetical protein Aglo02_14440 [Actinokineospora globicatena]|nr:hypothetical protein Aglo02_14440 [Actinokineospora globicatena]
MAEQAPDERGGGVVQGRPAEVDVVVGLLAGRERDLAVHDGEFGHQAGEFTLGSGVDRRSGSHEAQASHAHPVP